MDGLRTSYLTVGQGPTLLLLHSGEYGASSELSWEYNLDTLGERFTVVAPDWLGFGDSAKVFDFEAGTGRLVSHLQAFCHQLGIANVPIIATSLGATLALADASAENPQLPAAAIVAICGGGDIASNEDVDALFAYDGSLTAMKRLVQALFADDRWADDAAYVARRHAQSVRPGAWECVAAPRFHSPDFDRQPRDPRTKPRYELISKPTLLIAGELDKIKPASWAFDLSRRIPGSEALVVPNSGHFPHIERPDFVHSAIFNFLSRVL